MSKVLISLITNDEQDYIRECIDGIYDFADQIVIVHGEAYDQSPKDETFTGTIIASHPDPEGKIVSRYVPRSFPDKKAVSFEIANERGYDWYMTVDADEFYTGDDLVRLRCILDEDKDTDVFLMQYFAFCYNFKTGYWDTVDPAYPPSERIWRRQRGLHTRPGHCEVFYDVNGVKLRDKRSRKICLAHDGVMMYHMTFVKDPEKIRQRMIQRLGPEAAIPYVEEVLYALTPENTQAIYQHNVSVRGVYGIHWAFQNVVLGEWIGRELPEVLRGHPRRTIEWEV